MPLNPVSFLYAALILSISFISCESNSDSYRDEVPKLVALKETSKEEIITPTTIPADKTSEKKKKKKYSEPVPIPLEDPRLPQTPIDPRVYPFSQPYPEPSTQAIDDENTVYDVVDISAEFPDGAAKLKEYMRDNLRYPDQAEEMGITGKVFVGFVVRTDGSITDVIIKRGVDPLLDSEAKRFVKAMPKWTPGKIKDKAVNSRFVLPIKFYLR